jgi:hypothetical protein
MVIALPTPQGKPNLTNARKPRQLRLSAIGPRDPRAAFTARSSRHLSRPSNSLTMIRSDKPANGEGTTSNLGGQGPRAVRAG